jgi:uncharacterized repeat protein (TIGR01451 family)
MIIGTGIVSTLPTDSDLTNNTTSSQTLITAIPTNDLGVTKVATTSTAKVGQNLGFIITVTNNGPLNETNATLIDYWPA